MISTGIGVTAVHHDVGGKTRLRKRCFTFRNINAVIVRAVTTATKDDVSVGIASGLKDGNDPLRVNSKETVGMLHRLKRIDGDVKTTVRSVFKPHG